MATSEQIEDSLTDSTSSRYRSADIEAYQKVWDAQLPKDPIAGIICVTVTLAIGTSFICFPWVLSYLQDEGLIHPHIDLQVRAPQPLSSYTRQPRQAQYRRPANQFPVSQMPTASEIQAFGKPRQAQ